MSRQYTIPDEMRDIQQVIYFHLYHEGIFYNPQTWAPLQRKLSKHSVRSSFAVWSYEYLSQDQIKSHLPLTGKEYLFRVVVPFTVEAVIVHAYLYKQIFDKKNGVNDEKSIQANHKQALDLEEGLLRAIRQNERIALSERRIISRYIREMMVDISLGQTEVQKHSFEIFQTNKWASELNKQSLECSFLKKLVKSLQKEFPAYKESILFYFIRNYYISASLFKKTVHMLCKLMEKEVPPELLNFAENYGVLLQLINDISDFAFAPLNPNKMSSVVFSDLKNKTITLPMIFHSASQLKGVLNNYLTDPNFHKPILTEQYNLILKEGIQSGALIKSITIGKDIAKYASASLKKEELQSTKKLRYLCEVAEYNRYYYHFFKAKKHYKKMGFNGFLYDCRKNRKKKKLADRCPVQKLKCIKINRKAG